MISKKKEMAETKMKEGSSRKRKEVPVDSDDEVMGGLTDLIAAF